MKRIVCSSTQRIVDDGTLIPAGTPHLEQDAVAEQLIAQGLAREAPQEPGIETQLSDVPLRPDDGSEAVQGESSAE